MSDVQFYEEDTADNYAQARYLLYYLPYDDTPCVTGPSLPFRALRA